MISLASHQNTGSIDVFETIATSQAGPTLIPAPEQQIVLSAEQQHVLEIVERGESVFFTGPAGTGKSVLLREIVATLRASKPVPGSVAITAPTGIAGINIGGCTIHSFAGVRLGKEEERILALRIGRSPIMLQRWTDLETLIIDEVSMLEGRLFDKLECIARIVRGNEAPFGGVQLILSGDFCQLPPVPDESHQHRLDSTFCFDARSWSSCITQPPVRLTQVFRQKDQQFVNILSAMRVGSLSDDQCEMLSRLSRPLVYSDGIEATELYPTRAEVDACNQQRLKKLSGAPHTYIAVDRAGCDVRGRLIPKEDAIRLLDRLSIVPSSVTFKVGAQVMLIKNIAQGSMVNGSTGKVIEFITTAEALKREIQISLPNRGEKRAQNDKQRKADEIAERRRLDSLYKMVPMNGAVFSKNQRFPLVQFTNGLILLCAPVAFSVEGFIGNVECERLQVPLVLAWAMSIHKSQGQTLSRVKVNLSRIFEKGQTYVAISRATSMEQLEIQNFNPVKVQAHPRVLAWEAEWMPKPLVAATTTISSGPQTSTDEPMSNVYEADREYGNSLPSRQPDSKADYEMLWEEMDSEDAINLYHDR
ncbi:hypothetical protein E1B28_001400 [Marasmius oreades]|nr:uncharacterized protein E1B28_001400 [Marasmius oreades]KAG7099570.1 hypothetical protein E1B28_001400 [Marasmius oreades]